VTIIQFRRDIGSLARADREDEAGSFQGFQAIQQLSILRWFSRFGYENLKLDLLFFA
jgi:hypothetical protein